MTKAKQLQLDHDNLADIAWWLKGYKAGADNTFNGCPFNDAHSESLSRILRHLKEHIGEQEVSA
jgi:hypothetical protein